MWLVSSEVPPGIAQACNLNFSFLRKDPHQLQQNFTIWHVPVWQWLGTLCGWKLQPSTLKRCNPVIASSTMCASPHGPARKQVTQLRAIEMQPCADDAETMQQNYATLRLRMWRNPVSKRRDLVEFVLLRYLLVASLELLHLKFRQIFW